MAKTAAPLGARETERLTEIAEELFASAVAQGMHSPFSLDCEYWGRDYGVRLEERLRDAGLVA